MTSINAQYTLNQSTGFDSRLVEQFRESLRVERACFQRRLVEAEISIARQHSGLTDDAEVRPDLDVAVALAAAARRALEEISEALGRLDSATFGLCAGCGKLIPFERLRAWPRARFCVHCK
ncbi:MAG: TraR/DksA family transcriptional regulator [Acidimicrobiia bacterium]